MCLAAYKHLLLLMSFASATSQLFLRLRYEAPFFKTPFSCLLCAIINGCGECDSQLLSLAKQTPILGEDYGHSYDGASDSSLSEQSTSSSVSSGPHSSSTPTNELPQVGVEPAENEVTLAAATTSQNNPLPPSSSGAKAASSVSRSSTESAMISRIADKIRAQYAQPKTKLLLVEDKGLGCERPMEEVHVEAPDLGGSFAPLAQPQLFHGPQSFSTTRVDMTLRAEPMRGAACSDYAVAPPHSTDRAAIDAGNTVHPPHSVTGASTCQSVPLSTGVVAAPATVAARFSDALGTSSDGLTSAIARPTPSMMHMPATPIKATARIERFVPPIGTATPTKGCRPPSNGLLTPNATPVKRTNGGLNFGSDQKLSKAKRRDDEFEHDEVDQAGQRPTKRQKSSNHRDPRRDKRNRTRQHGASSSRLPILQHALPAKPTSGVQEARDGPSMLKRPAGDMEEGEIDSDDEPVIKRQRLHDSREQATSSRASSPRSSSTRGQLLTPESSPVKRPFASSMGSRSG